MPRQATSLMRAQQAVTNPTMAPPARRCDKSMFMTTSERCPARSTAAPAGAIEKDTAAGGEVRFRSDGFPMKEAQLQKYVLRRESFRARKHCRAEGQGSLALIGLSRRTECRS